MGLVAVLLWSMAAQAASFDCAKAKTAQEKAICASPELNAADERMAAAYKAVQASVPAELKEEVLGDQRAWIRRTAGGCKSQEALPAPALAMCLTVSYQSRIAELEHMIVVRGGVKFFWRSITIKVADEDDSPADPDSREENPGFGTLDASWPKALSAAPQWVAWNNDIEAAARGMALCEGTSSDQRHPPRWDATPGADQQISVKLGFVSPKLVTATLTNVWDGHGAHPNTGTSEFNWSVENQRELTPNDIFLADSSWEQELYSRTYKYLVKQFLHQPAELQKTVHNIVVNTGAWHIDEQGLTITFQQYELGGRNPPEPFTLAWADLKPYLQSGFVLPK
jgi:uncharacterized protein